MRKAANQPDWKGGFLFIGNQLALDFINTRPVQNGEPMELLPHFDALLHWFQTANLLSSGHASNLRRQWGETARARKTTGAMRELREMLRDEILTWERGAVIRHTTIDELNKYMAVHPMRTKLTRNKKAHSTQMWFELREPEDLFAPLVHSAATLFSTVDRERIRKCGRCVLHFHDTSKKGTRRWCSMQLCGNRLKVAAYAARQRLRAQT